MKKVILAVLVITAALIALFYTVNQRDYYEGSWTRDEDCFLLEFTKMNREDSHSFELKAGDTISVDFAIEKGDAELTIGRAEETPIYQGNKLESGTFEVKIPEDGSYLIRFKAKHAAGFLKVCPERT